MKNFIKKIHNFICIKKNRITINDAQSSSKSTYSTFVQNLNSGFTNLDKNALIYYKTSPYNDPECVKSYTHTNNWEILTLQYILNSLGFCVDVVDRTNGEFKVEKKYDIFMGIGSGNSGKFYSKIASQLPNTPKIMLATGAAPDLSHENVLKRYQDFFHRTGIYAEPMRTREHVMGEHFKEILKYTDCIFSIGERDAFAHKSYEGYGKQIFNYYPAVSKAVIFNLNWLKSRKINNFLCFAGNGFISKGVDIIVEVFLKRPELNLTICGPNTEKAFFEAYDNLISKSQNIKYLGFISVHSDEFRKLCSENSYVILNSSSESCATSVATCMKAGLVPIINFETSLHVDTVGKLIKNTNYPLCEINESITWGVELSQHEYRDRALKTVFESQKYSQESFTLSMKKNILQVIKQYKI